MASKPRPWSRTGCFSSPRRAKLCQRRCGSTTPTSWPTPTAVCGARVCQYQVKNIFFPGKLIIQDGRARFADLFTFSQSFFLSTNKEIVELKEERSTKPWTSKQDLFVTIDLIFYSYPSSDTSYSIVRKKLTANSHFTFQINNSTSELLESF